MPNHPIPDAALESDIAILGKKGRGKSYTARGLVERLLDMGRQVVVLDPLSTWWGLKAGPNGYPIPVIGGPQGDLPLDAAAGAALGIHLASVSQSVVLDLGAFRKTELIRFATPLLEELYTHNRKPLWLVLEEADVFAPQQPMPETARMLGEVDRIARRGRQFGFKLISLTQRPARLNKDVLTQLSTLVALGLTSPQDRDAIKAWVDGAGDRDKAKAVLDSLASLKVGEGWVWSPDHEILERVTFPKIKTPDTSATPKAGEPSKTAAVRKDVDVEALRTALMAAVPAEVDAKATQPRSADDLAAAERRGYERGLQDGETRGLGDRGVWARRGAEAMCEAILGAIKGVNLVDVLRADAAAWRTVTGEPDPEDAATRVSYGSPSPQNVAAAPQQAPAARANGHAVTANGKLGSERRILAVLVSAHPAGMTESQWAVAAGMKRSGGTWGTYKSRLRGAGAIESRGGQWVATPAGLGMVGAAVEPMPPPGPELVEFWITRISGVGPMLRALSKRYPLAVEREALAGQIGMTASGGTFGTYLSRLSAAGLIEKIGSNVRAAPALMEVRRE